MLVLLLLGQFMGLVDVFIVNVAMPSIGTELHASGASLQLVVGGYTVAYAMLLITGARLGDLYGRRRMYLLGVVAFTLTSVGCAFAPDAATLVVFRFAQGASAAVMVPQIMSVIQMQFQGPARAKALSAYGAVLSTGAVAGLVLGGVIVNADLFGASWRPVFLVNVPIGLVLIALVPRLLPKDAPTGRRKLDLQGLALAVPAVFLLVLPAVLGRELDWPAWTFVCMAAGVVLAAVFVRVERGIAARGGDPLLNLAVLRAPGMSIAMITVVCVQLTYGGFLFVFTLHLQQGLAETALRAGLTYLPMSITFGLAGFYWRKLPARIHHLLAPGGLAVSALSYGLVAIAMQDGGSGGALMWIGTILNGVGMGLSVSPLLTQALVNVPMDKAADASGLLTTIVQLGQVGGIAVYGALYLTLVDRTGDGVRAHVLGTAMSTSAVWILVVAALGVVPGLLLSRVVLRARRPAPAAPAAVPSPTAASD
ncbi:MFS transporter [Kitasatospora phosalacinea]|uniref:MFS transporter n=2 Tax=Kitasatospora phosalacinea TaxID=2065 RepID=A0A9W6Q419_9ACTN|nr:MFS transporter [Kitasatospora phosalacinea]